MPIEDTYLFFKVYFEKWSYVIFDHMIICDIKR